MSTVNEETLVTLLHSRELSRSDRLLLCLYSLGDGAHSIAALRVTINLYGLSNANLARDLSRMKGHVFRTNDNFKMTLNGKNEAKRLLGIAQSRPVIDQVSQLRLELITLPAGTKEFVTEAIKCAEYGLYRSSVILSWVGALSLLYHHVNVNCLDQFNIEALKRNQKWRNALTTDDLARLPEYDFLQICCAISVFGQSIKQALEKCLQLRNACGHPNDFKLGENTCVAHLEVLLLNVFKKF